MADTLTAKAPSAAPPAAPENERRVSVKLLNDVWIKDPGHPDAGPDGVRRVRTNIVTLDDEGKPVVDRKTKNFVCTQIIADIPVSIAKALIAASKAERTDPL